MKMSKPITDQSIIKFTIFFCSVFNSIKKKTVLPKKNNLSVWICLKFNPPSGLRYIS